MEQPVELAGPLTDIETIAVGSAIRELARLRDVYGSGRWRKLKAKAAVLRPNGRVVLCEVHWYEAHGIGRKEMKVKRRLE